jgi:hypothetical protein
MRGRTPSVKEFCSRQRIYAVDEHGLAAESG